MRWRRRMRRMRKREEGESKKTGSIRAAVFFTQVGGQSAKQLTRCPHHYYQELKKINIFFANFNAIINIFFNNDMKNHLSHTAGVNLSMNYCLLSLMKPTKLIIHLSSPPPLHPVCSRGVEAVHVLSLSQEKGVGQGGWPRW